MSSCIDAASEQVCYIPCNFCNIILAVIVPSSNLFDIVTVRCGHCTNLWSVNMAAALQSLSWQEMQGPGFTSPDYRIDLATSSRSNKVAMQVSARNNNEGIPAINRPPEKRQRVPSAYNQFIKEEIQRIKANNPEISHREAFSTAAKNVSCRTYLGTLPSHSFWADAGDQQSSQTQLVKFLNGSFESEEALDSGKHLIPKAAL